MSATGEPTEPPRAALPGNRAAFAGLAFSGLYLASFLAVRGLPQASRTDTEILRYYASNDVDYLKLVTLYLIPFAGIAFLWFLAAFRDRIVRLAGTESTMLSTVQILSGAIYVAMQFSAAASIVTVALSLDSGVPSPTDVEAVRPFLVLADTILVVFALRAAAVFMMAGTTRALRAGLFPRWFGLLSYLLAIVLVVTVEATQERSTPPRLQACQAVRRRVPEETDRARLVAPLLRGVGRISRSSAPASATSVVSVGFGFSAEKSRRMASGLTPARRASSAFVRSSSSRRASSARITESSCSIRSRASS